MITTHKVFPLIVFILILAIRPTAAQTTTETVIHSFCAQTNCLDGSGPEISLQALNGYLYGATSAGGTTSSYCSSNPCGVLFKLTLGGVYSVLDNTFGVSVIQGANGDFYGIDFNYFKMSPSGQINIINNTEGGGNLVAAANGDFYGIAGEYIYSITPDGTKNIIYQFCPSGFNCSAGYIPTALIQGSDGNLYGTTESGGTADSGTIFKLTSSGDLTLLHQFCLQSGCPDGENPTGFLIEGKDGNFYGTTQLGGANGAANASEGGTVFKITPFGTLTTLYSFCSTKDFNGTCTDGVYPNDLILAGDGKFYGTTFQEGNDNSGGTAFQLSYSGDLHTLYDFCSEASCTDGSGPGGLLAASDGNLYGVTGGGGANGNYGVVFKLGFSSALPAPVQLTLSSSSVQPGTPVTVSLKVLNAFSLTMQQCYAFQNLNGALTPLGKVPGTYSSQTKLYTFSTTFNAPATAGIYNYAVTCGGVESGFASLTVGNTTTTTLAASPSTVMPPGNVTLTATVAATSGSGAPTGSVTFYYQTTALGTATLNSSGVATLQASSKGVPAGTYAITATYSGSATDITSTSAAVDVTVQ